MIPGNLDSSSRQLTPDQNEDSQASRHDHLSSLPDYQTSPDLAYRFDNPGYAIVGQRPNPDIDPLRLDTAGEIWCWRKGMPIVHWAQLQCVPSLKEMMKEFIFHKIQRASYTGGAMTAIELISVQDIYNDPADWPWTQPKVLQILLTLKTRPERFASFKEFYLWASKSELPGFRNEIAYRIIDMQATPNRNFILYAGIKQRKHVLSLHENKAIHNSLKYKPIPTRIPSNYRSDDWYSIEDVCYWLGNWEMRPTSARTDNANMLKKFAAARNLLTVLGIDSIPLNFEYRTASRSGYIARSVYPAGKLIPTIRAFLVRNKLIELRSNIMTHIAFALGPRPSQICGIDETSFVKYCEAGAIFYSLDIPSRKKGSTGKRSKRRKFPEEIGLGQKIETFISLKREAESIGILTESSSQIRPLFISACKNTILSGLRPTEQDVGSTIGNYLQLTHGLNRSARDLRANVGQRLADAGYSGQLIAEILDHSDQKNIDHYVQASLNLSEIMDLALANHDGYKDRMEKLRGVKTIKLKDITKSTDVISGIVNRNLISGIGACSGNPSGNTPCENEPIYSCYLDCPAFEPLDDPKIHQEVLAAVKSEVIEFFANGEEDAEAHSIALTHQELIVQLQAMIEVIGGASK